MTIIVMMITGQVFAMVVGNVSRTPAWWKASPYLQDTHTLFFTDPISSLMQLIMISHWKWIHLA